MKDSLKDLTLNVKKSIDREYEGEYNMQPNFRDDQKVLNDDIILSIQDSYDDEYDASYDDDIDDIIVDHDIEEEVIEPDEHGVDAIRLIKVKSVKELSDEFDNINKTAVPAIIDFKYIQERRPADFKKVGKAIKTFKEVTGGEIVLLGTTKTVVVVAPPEVRIIR